MKILGKERLHDLGFDIPAEGRLMARQAIMLNRVEVELPSTSDLAKADNMELQAYTENAVRSTENLNQQFEGESSEN